MKPAKESRAIPYDLPKSRDFSFTKLLKWPNFNRITLWCTKEGETKI